MLVQLRLVRMPTLYELKPRFQGMLRPMVGRLAAAGVTANQVTIGTGVASVMLGAGLALEHRGWILLPAFLFARMALNAIDGMLACLRVAAGRGAEDSSLAIAARKGQRIGYIMPGCFP